MNDRKTDQEPDDDMTTFIKQAQSWGKNFEQAFWGYIDQYPPADHPDRGDMDEAEFVGQILFPQFKKIWIEIEKERTKDWITCSNCHELLPPVAFYKSSIQVPGVTDVCIKCRQIIGGFGFPKRKKKK